MNSNYEDITHVWKKFPPWLNQEYFKRTWSITEQECLLLSARQNITEELVKLATGNSYVTYYYYNRNLRYMIPKNIIILVKELEERFSCVKVLVPRMINKFISIDDYDPSFDLKPTKIRIQLIKDFIK